MVHASFTLCPVLQSCKHSKSIQTVYEITCTTADFQLWEDEIKLIVNSEGLKYIFQNCGGNSSLKCFPQEGFRIHCELN